MVNNNTGILRVKSNDEELKNEIKILKKENANLERKLAVLYNVVEVTTYINSFISEENILQLINDMIIGILGVQYSTIYIKEDGELRVKATNMVGGADKLNETIIEYMEKGVDFIINSKENTIGDKNTNIYSKMGIPIKIGNNVMGYIIGQHIHHEYFNNEHKILIGAVANQVAITLDNSNLYRKLEEAAKIDSLMNIYNRGTFFEIVKENIEKDINNFAIVMIDLDNFKKINDTLGHQMGDKVLKETASIIKSYINKDDFIGRYGGEEIIVFIREKDSEKEIIERVNKLRAAVEKNKIASVNGEVNITASFGLSFKGKENKPLEEIIEKADKALYRAKKLGRNRVITI